MTRAAFRKARYRLMRAVVPSVLSWEDVNRPSWAVQGPGTFSAGDWTYWSGDTTFRTWKPSDAIALGAYCSVGGEVMLLAGGDHDVSALSAYPFSLLAGRAVSAEPQSSQEIGVGNDVWIANRAIVLGGVHIGHGAVVAAGAVVTSDVPAYAFVAGVPARVLRYRFEPDEIERLLRLRWWNWPVERVLEAEPLLRSARLTELAQFAARHGLLSGDVDIA